MAVGGHFTTNAYIAYKCEGGKLEIGCLQIKGAALNAWVDFRKEAKDGFWSKAVAIGGSKDGQKGKVKFKTPTMVLKDVSKETDDEAGELQNKVQAYLKDYYSRTKSVQTSAPAHPAEAPQGDAQEDHDQTEGRGQPKHEPAEPESDDVPF